MVPDTRFSAGRDSPRGRGAVQSGRPQQASGEGCREPEPAPRQPYSGWNQRLLMYIVTSKPKRMSLYSGVSHFMVISFWSAKLDRLPGLRDEANLFRLCDIAPATNGPTARFVAANSSSA
jgi:hypothetical protein